MFSDFSFLHFCLLYTTYLAILSSTLSYLSCSVVYFIFALYLDAPVVLYLALQSCYSTIYIIPQKPSTLISFFISASSSLSISLCAFVKYPTRLRLGFKQVNSISDQHRRTPRLPPLSQGGQLPICVLTYREFRESDPRWRRSRATARCLQYIAYSPATAYSYLYIGISISSPSFNSLLFRSSPSCAALPRYWAVYVSLSLACIQYPSDPIPTSIVRVDLRL